MRCTCVVILGLFAAAAAGGDERAAAFFTDRGQKALDAGDTEGAAVQFQKALGESPDYLPALLGLAKVAKAAGRAEDAVTGLERILDIAKSGSSSAACTEAARAARELLREMDRPRADYREMIEEYTGALYELYLNYRASDPDLAARCLDRILAVCPEDEKARRLRTEIALKAPSSAAKPGDTPLFNGRDFEGWTDHAPAWVVSANVLACDAGDGACFIRTVRNLSGDYSVEIEARILKDAKEHPRCTPSIMIQWGCQGMYDHWWLAVTRSAFWFRRFKGAPNEFDVLSEPDYSTLKAPFDRTQWNLYRVDVRGDTAAFSVNGVQVVLGKAAAGQFDGAIALSVQDCAAEFRRIAIVK